MAVGCVHCWHPQGGEVQGAKCCLCAKQTGDWYESGLGGHAACSAHERCEARGCEMAGASVNTNEVFAE